MARIGRALRACHAYERQSLLRRGEWYNVLQVCIDGQQCIQFVLFKHELMGRSPCRNQREVGRGVANCKRCAQAVLRNGLQRCFELPREFGHHGRVVGLETIADLETQSARGLEHGVEFDQVPAGTRCVVQRCTGFVLHDLPFLVAIILTAISVVSGVVVVLVLFESAEVVEGDFRFREFVLREA